MTTEITPEIFEAEAMQHIDDIYRTASRLSDETRPTPMTSCRKPSCRRGSRLILRARNELPCMAVQDPLQ